MDRYAIVETDNYAGDYPDEKFVEPLPFLNEENANKIADLINDLNGERFDRYYKVVKMPYVLQPGFEP
jgi:hypothetical protein